MVPLLISKGQNRGQKRFLIKINGDKIMGEFNLLDLKFIMTQSGQMAFGRGFALMSWQEGKFERERITPYAIGPL